MGTSFSPKTFRLLVLMLCTTCPEYVRRGEDFVEIDAAVLIPPVQAFQEIQLKIQCVSAGSCKEVKKEVHETGIMSSFKTCKITLYFLLYYTANTMSHKPGMNLFRWRWKDSREVEPLAHL